MDDFKIIARLLAAVRVGEGQKVFDCALVDEKVMKAPAAKRDSLAIKLQKEGLIDGLFVVDDIDNQPLPVVMWEYSHPSITLAGLEYIDTNSALKKALRELRDIGAAVAGQAIAATITNMAKWRIKALCSRMVLFLCTEGGLHEITEAARACRDTERRGNGGSNRGGACTEILQRGRLEYRAVSAVLGEFRAATQ